MRNAWILVFALVGVGLTACGTPTSGADAGPDTGFIMLHDSGDVDAPGRDAPAPIDANVPPYDGGAAFSCTGLAPVTPAGYCAAYADTYVALYTRCGLLGAAGATELHAAVLSGCNTSRVQAAVTAGTATWDANMAACCLGHSAHDTSCFLNVAAGVPECDFIHGTVANGHACSTGADCMNGFCHIEDTCTGVCTAFAVTGAVCNVGDVTCDATSTCDTSTHHCTTQTATAGATCSSATNTQCEPTLTCLDPDGNGTGTCTALPHRGQPCDSNMILCDLNSGICDYDYASMSGFCVPPLAEGSMRCIIDAQCLGDAYCRGASFGMMTYGTCTARAHRGASCMTDKCVDGLVCRPDHTCGDAPTIGQPCTATSGCADGLCSGGGTCIARHPAGDHCTENNQCASGNCRTSTLTCAPVCP